MQGGLGELVELGILLGDVKDIDGFVRFGVNHDDFDVAALAAHGGCEIVQEAGPVFMGGIQALVRLPMLIRDHDRRRGLNTAGFISGYRGSPLGGYDTQLELAAGHLAAHDIVFRHAINEDLAATAVWGTQHVPLFPGAKSDGVFGLWYGKSPGVDRSMDAIRHANFAGTSPLGGVLAIAGDDHASKSSTLPNQSEFAFMDAEIPVLAPATLDEVIDFGVRGVSLSRYSTVGSLMGNLVGGRMAIEGRIARFVYASLYRMHLFAIHGASKGAAMVVYSWINRIIRPRLKLH